MINVFKDTKVYDTNYVVSEDKINVEETDLVICHHINDTSNEVQYQAYYILNGKNFGE